MTHATLRFLGGARTVTGSKAWLRAGARSYLIDCGIFQGPDELEQLDWGPLPFAPRDLDAVLLTHAHIDHSGFLPRLVALGFEGPVYATPATIALLGILLPDSAFIQEEQARYANRKGYSRHRPALPLYTSADADRALRLLRPLPYREPFAIDEGLSVLARPAGHLLGSATLQLEVRTSEGPVRIVFSGDVGRYGQEMMRDPEPVPSADYLVVESTYGDRMHPREGVEAVLAEALAHVRRYRGALVVPSFAVGRAQHVLYHLHRLQQRDGLRDVPVFVDSPMALDATQLYAEHGDEANLRLRLRADDPDCPIRPQGVRFVRSVEESKRLNEREGPLVVISANGMATAGRVMHHLRARLADPRNAVLFVGHQAEGTRGRRILDGAAKVRFHGEEVRVRARVLRADGLSSHADQGELLRWLRGFRAPPELTLVDHGEAATTLRFAAHIERTLGWRAHAPARMESVPLKPRASPRASS